MRNTFVPFAGNDSVKITKLVSPAEPVCGAVIREMLLKLAERMEIIHKIWEQNSGKMLTLRGKLISQSAVDDGKSE